MKRLEAHITKTHKPAGGLFLGLRFHYPITVQDKQFKLVNKKFVRVGPWRVSHLDIGLLTHTISIYIRKQKPI